MNLGMRHIFLSTCGLVDRIYDLAEENLQPDPFGFPARSQQCDPQPDHAGEPKISH